MKNYCKKNKIKIWLSKKSFVFVILLFVYLLFVTQPVHSKEQIGAIIYVDKNGAGNFSTIQDGLDAANPGFTVFVKNGTYYENIVIEKSLTLIGEDKANTIIDGREIGNTIKINANNVNISGFTIQHSGVFFPNSGINISSNYNIIKDNIINNNYYAMTLYHSSYNTISDNLIQNDDSCGIYMSRSSDNNILNNTIQNNRYNGIGIYDQSNSNLIKNNNFTQNGYCGVNIRVSSSNIISENYFLENNIGIHLPNLENILSDDNTFVDNSIDVDREFFLKTTDILIIISAISIGVILIAFFLKIKKK